MKQHTVTEIVDSLFENPNEWKFSDDDITSRFIHHKSGFALHVASVSHASVWMPREARFIKFSNEEMRLISSAVKSLREERIDKLQNKTRASIANMLVLKENLPWWKRIFR